MFVARDFVNPHQTFIDDQLFFELDPKVAKKANLFVQFNEASLEDDFI